jgi:5-enolpyruvylshikimate-3-phosphate synthase
MTKPIIKIHNAETGEEIEREMNAVEFAQYKIDQEAAAALKVEETNKAAAKAALLDRLGITAEEATLLLA